MHTYSFNHSDCSKFSKKYLNEFILKSFFYGLCWQLVLIFQMILASYASLFKFHSNQCAQCNPYSEVEIINYSFYQFSPISLCWCWVSYYFCGKKFRRSSINFKNAGTQCLIFRNFSLCVEILCQLSVCITI